MSSATELRTWLNRPEHNFCANLAFGINAWRSIEFVLITKHEIITEEFCRNLPALRKELKKSGQPADDAWALICEFLGLKYAAGAISSAVKEQLVTALRTEARKTLAAPNARILDALLLTLHNSAMQNFYKSAPDTLADLVGTISAYLRQLVDQQPAEWLAKQPDAITKLLAGVLQFVKQTPLLEVFRRRFAAEAYVPFVELVLALRSKGHNYGTEFFAIVQEMFFPAGSATALRAYLKTSGGGATAPNSEFAVMFDSPTHALAMWLESILIAFKLDTDTQVALHRFLFDGMFASADDAEATVDLLPRVTYYLSILKRHDVQMTAKLGDDGTKVSTFLGQHVERLFAGHHEAQLADTLDMLCAALRLDPIMLEHTMLPLAVKCMVQPKDEATAERFAEYLILVINVYRKLSRAAKFVAHLIRSLVELLAVTKLSSRIKRKSLAAGTAAIGSKKSKTAAGEESSVGEPTSPQPRSTANRYFEQLQAEFSNRGDVSTVCPSSASDWPDIAFAWPASVGNAFVQFIGGLVSAPSLIVWKTILFSLTDYLSLLKEGHSDTNTLFLVDICSALFCQYFAGARLAEHTDQTWAHVDRNRTLTHSLLHEFGKAILSKEHNNRTMNAFLKCCLHAADFELLCFYYWPDTLAAREPLALVHPYLQEPPQQWTLVEQRITNFGRDECKANINRIYMQRMYGLALFERRCDALPLVGLSELHQVQTVLGGAAAAVLVRKLAPAEMRALCAILVGNDVPLSAICGRALRDKMFVYVLYVQIFNQACSRFGSGSKAPTSVDADALVAAIGAPEYADTLAELAVGVEESARSGGHIKKANIEAILLACKQLRQLPTDFLDIQTRNVLFVLKVALFVGAKKTQNEALIGATVGLLRAFVHFGDTPELFAVLPIESWVRIFGCSAEVLPLYATVFERVTRDPNATNVRMFDSLLGLLRNDDESAAGDGDLLDIGMVLVDQMAKEKKCKEHYAQYRSVILAAIRQHLAQTKRTDTIADQRFVARTLAGFVTVLSATITKAEAAEVIDDSVRAAFKVYAQHASIGGNFGASIRLLNMVLAHKTLLGWSEDEIKALVDRFWGDYLVALRDKEAALRVDEYSEIFLKSVLNSKTSEEFIELLDEGGDATAAKLVENFDAYKHKLFASIGKCQLNKVKGSIFNEIFKQLSLRIVLSLRVQGALQQHPDTVLKLLECQRIICTNVQLPVSIELVDDIIAFLSEINIKSFGAQGTGASTATDEETTARSARFVQLHTAMSDVCFALVQHRHFYVIDRVAQFGGIVRDLLQAVAFFKTAAKGDRTVGALDKGEVTMLADLSHRMENIIKSFVKHAKDVKRIAPYLLLSTINLLVSDDQPTTNFSKIKSHFDFICFDLISVCDHRVEGFVMRNCNEASKQVYEQLNRDFNKYHKFKGKV